MKKLLYTTLLAAGLLYGCKDTESDVPPPDGSVYSENFVQLYILNEDIILSRYSDRYIRMEFTGEVVGNTDPAQSATYDRLSLRYHDRTYNRRILANHNYALANSLSGISIICRNDFDEAHPAGAAINDLVKLCASSCREYIGNGYRMPDVGNAFPDEFDGLTLNESLGYVPVFRELDKFEPSESLELLDRVCYLYFTEIPEPGGYTFEVALNAGDELLKKEIAVRF